VKADPALRLERAVVTVVGALAVIAILRSLIDLLTYYPYGVDLEIPLRAASRWVAGGQPYLPEAFNVPSGAGLPFLYPPATLPFIAPLLAIPRFLLFPAWTAVCVGAGVFACRRLALPWWLVPIALAWPPFAEGILGGNVQLILFAAFTSVFWRGGGAPFAPLARDPRDADRPAAADGLLAAAIGALKISQAHTWLFMLRRRPVAAAIGAVVVIAIVVTTLPLVRIDRWADWIGQAGRSGDPTWVPAGLPLSMVIGRAPALVVTALTLLAMFAVPVGRAGAWTGLLSMLGAPSIHMFGLLFLIPSMLAIRRDLAVVAALAIATYTDLGFIVGVLLAGSAFALSGRVPMFAARLEPSPET
jgi:hypothetical protein